MYSHDTYGLGHIRRTMAIANHLRGPDVNILILTGSPLVGRFSLPDQIDFVRIPGMIKKTNDEYLPLSIKINAEHALDIRKSIIKATAQTFQPQLFIVDKEPLGLRKEVLPTLEWIRDHLPEARTILGLRDVMDEAGVVRADWEANDVYDLLKDLYSEIWVYGRRDFYDPIQQYGISEEISRKITFTGYIPRQAPSPQALRKIRKKSNVGPNERMVVVTTGGGGDGYALMDVYLDMLEHMDAPPDCKSVLVTGPFMPKDQRDSIADRAKRVGIKCWHFYSRMEEILGAADLVVCMGGYNTICEILTQQTLALIVPRESPRMEQLIRAKVLKAQNLADYLPLSEYTPDALLGKIKELNQNPEPYLDAMSRFKLTGLDVMSQRLEAIRNQNP
jgi:predicted glycosyltransferase